MGMNPRDACAPAGFQVRWTSCQTIPDRFAQHLSHWAEANFNTATSPIVILYPIWSGAKLGARTLQGSDVRTTGAAARAESHQREGANSHRNQQAQSTRAN
jgi:hypothetical protein